MISRSVYNFVPVDRIAPEIDNHRSFLNPISAAVSSVRRWCGSAAAGNSIKLFLMDLPLYTPFVTDKNPASRIRLTCWIGIADPFPVTFKLTITPWCNW
ncbi:MAG TPA: hypothetical protein DCG12_11955 [Planctomycetaceae bacterium]|nr:hypothetical protein [Planctomycetaceae bacterium]